MALPSTPYKIDLNLSDLDRELYQNLRFTVSRHPSETAERLVVRLLAYALWYKPRLSFGKGLSDVDEPALGEKSLDDRLLHWIEIGQPDAERITWCARRCGRFSLMTYGSLRTYQSKALEAIKPLKNVHIVALNSEQLVQLSNHVSRSISWSLMISDGTLFVTDESEQQHEIALQWLQGERC